MKVTFN